MDSQSGAHELKDKIQYLLEEARGSMKVRGRDAMVGGDTKGLETSDVRADLRDSGSSERGKWCTVCQHMPCSCKADMAREDMLLRELYAALLAPVEAALTGAEEVLIVPHKELFEVPWAALIDARGRYLIERCVLRLAPSLRVVHQARLAAQRGAQSAGHVVLIGNPLPIERKLGFKWRKMSPDEHGQVLENEKLTEALASKTEFTQQELDEFGIKDIREDHCVKSGDSYFTPARFHPLPFAEQEAQGVHDILKSAKVLVKQEHFFKSDLHPRATKANVKKSLRGAGWAHFACHGDMDSDSLVLAVPDSDDTDHAQPDLSMLEVQGNDEESEGVRLSVGATAVLSACNTARGKIRAEGVVGMCRGFQLAGAAAVVVSLWSVDDGSTAALMQQMYRHLVKGLTVPQALRLAMLHLACRPAPENALESVEPSSAGGLRVEWKRPMHWAGFLVMGASTRLPLGGLTASAY